MTDKQIIIDGVDVSEWTDQEVYYKFEHHSPKSIRQIAFDLYKQLKRKEQECETLASQLDFEVQKKECLEQECEELKKQHQGDKGLITSTGKMNYQLLQEYDKLKTENDELKKQLTAYIKEAEENFEVHTTLKDNYRKLYQTLTEIKEIVTLDKTSFKYAGSTISICDDILIKISEVEDES